jgi:hypothetical protein
MFHALTKPMAAAVALTVGLTACGSSEGGDSAEQPAASVPAADTTGAAIWAHLQGSDYQTDWALWPDKGRLYPGGAPHGALLTTYLNDVAHEALASGAAELPVGAIVVKENFMPDSTLAAVTTMFKVAGYNADHNDWFFTKHLASGALDTMPNGMQMQGRLGGCQACHGARADNDYLFTSVLGGN